MNKSTTLWDVPVRIFHWSLLPLLVAAWLLVEYSEAIQDFLAAKDIVFDAMLWHARCGFVLLFLLLFRVLWGFVGSSSARFATFVRGPRFVYRYAKTLLQRASAQHAGHNPLGAWMVIVLMLLLFVQIASGLFLSDDIAFDGPFYAMVSENTEEVMEELHEIIFDLIIAAAALHISAILFYLSYKKQNLIVPMLTGKTDLPYENRYPYSLIRPMLVALIAAIPVYWLSHNYW